MSRKVDARANRVGITKGWHSVWYAEGEQYAQNLIEDAKIRKYIYSTLRTAGLDVVVIERSLKSVRIIIKAAKPGVVIGRKGVGLAQLRRGLEKLTKSEIEIPQMYEVKKPETYAKIVAESIAMRVERRISSKRAINIAADKTMDAGAKGVRIEIAGTLYGPSSIATVAYTVRGAVPTQTLRADVDFAKATAYTRGGTIGVKVWIYKGELER